MAGQTRTEIQAVSPHLEQDRKREGKKKKTKNLKSYLLLQ